MIFNWLIAGTDAHAKNYSLLLGDSTHVRLAPFYDLSSALPYRHLQKKKLKLAMKIGSHYRWWEVRIQDWLTLGAEFGFTESFTRECLRTLGKATGENATRVGGKLKAEGISHSILDVLVERIAESATRCIEMTGE